MGVPDQHGSYLINYGVHPLGEKKKETGGRRRWYNVFVPSVKTWKTNNDA
jgi:hypothetical protein